ncbi:hypothetical protein ALT1644_410001 [Alteromonas macleodii]
MVLKKLNHINKLGLFFNFGPGTIYLLPIFQTLNQKIDKTIVLFYHKLLW